MITDRLPILHPGAVGESVRIKGEGWEKSAPPPPSPASPRLRRISLWGLSGMRVTRGRVSITMPVVSMYDGKFKVSFPVKKEC